MWFNGVFTLPDTDTDFTFTDTGTDTDTMGFKPNCIGVGLGVGVGVGQCEHTISRKSNVKMTQMSFEDINLELG